METIEIVLSLVIVVICLIMIYMFHSTIRVMKEEDTEKDQIDHICSGFDEDDPCNNCPQKFTCDEHNVPEPEHFHVDALPNGFKRATKISNSIFRYVQEKGLDDKQLRERR